MMVKLVVVCTSRCAVADGFLFFLFSLLGLWFCFCFGWFKGVCGIGFAFLGCF